MYAVHYYTDAWYVTSPFSTEAEAQTEAEYLRRFPLVGSIRVVKL